MNLIPFFADRSHETQTPWITVIVTFFLGLWVIHGIFMLFFLSEKLAFRYQRLHVTVVNIVLVKMTIDPYLFYLMDVKEERDSIKLMLYGLVLLMLGVVYLLWSVQRAKINIIKGETRKEGRGIYYQGHCKLWAASAILFSVLLIIVVMVLALTGKGNFLLLLGIVPIQLVLSFAYPEFYFLAYYKFVNPVFIYERPPQRNKKG